MLSGGFRAVGPGYRIIGVEQPLLFSYYTDCINATSTEIRRVA